MLPTQRGALKGQAVQHHPSQCPRVDNKTTEVGRVVTPTRLRVVRLVPVLVDRRDGDRVDGVGVPIPVAVVVATAVPGSKDVDGAFTSSALSNAVSKGFPRQRGRACH